ncbi:MAG: hypothetical protein GY853_05640 [PVC group bacterium]|nr:hypothetical protein [PVC group bacterium]
MEAIMTMTFKCWLDNNDNKEEILNWVGDRTLEQAWAECPTGSWLLRIAKLGGVKHRLLVQAAFECVKRIEHLLPESPEVDTCCKEIKKYLQRETFASISESETAEMEVAALVVDERNYTSLSFYEASGWAATALADIGCRHCEGAVEHAVCAVNIAAGNHVKAKTRIAELEEKACAHIVRKIISFEVISDALKGIR